MNILKPFLLIVSLLLPNMLMAADNKPFIHQFGELRVYYKDWLVVCQDKGYGVCRMKTSILEDGQTFFDKSSVTYHPTYRAQKARLELFSRTPISTETGVITLRIDQQTFKLKAPNDFKPHYTALGGLVSETYDITNPKVLTPIVAAMKQGKRLSVQYDQHAPEIYSLRGVIASLLFIQQNEVDTRETH